MATFQPKARMKEARLAVRDAKRLGVGQPVEQVVRNLMLDLAKDLSSYRVGHEEDAFKFVLECMRSIVEGKATAAAPVWKWPEVNKPASGASGGLFGDDMPEKSALKIFGYTVGKTHGWPKAKRQAFLRDFMTMSLPPVVERVFPGQYGAPLSTDRLRKVANVIASNASNFFLNDPVIYAKAIADWEADLAFLKREFYEGLGLKFKPWPSSRPK